MLRPSRINPKLSAYMQIWGAFDFNKTPLAPIGCKAVIHDRPENRGSWDSHGTLAYYIDIAEKTTTETTNAMYLKHMQQEYLILSNSFQNSYKCLKPLQKTDLQQY